VVQGTLCLALWWRVRSSGKNRQNRSLFTSTPHLKNEILVFGTETVNVQKKNNIIITNHGRSGGALHQLPDTVDTLIITGARPQLM